MKKYSWSWFDGDGNYTNESDGLEPILFEVLEYYFCETDAISISKADGYFSISIVSEAASASYVVNDDPECVRKFLEQQASQQSRPDRFGILCLQ